MRNVLIVASLCTLAACTSAPQHDKVGDQPTRGNTPIALRGVRSELVDRDQIHRYYCEDGGRIVAVKWSLTRYAVHCEGG